MVAFFQIAECFGDWLVDCNVYFGFPQITGLKGKKGVFHKTSDMIYHSDWARKYRKLNFKPSTGM
jgi:hypothetical protein